MEITEQDTISFVGMNIIKACSKRRAIAVPNSNEFGSAVARR